ncbi:GRDP1 [Symbiodinium sp. CCMP2592]|nr:GRDP1 [Symbiodinium sp. CCMP2592]
MDAMAFLEIDELIPPLDVEWVWHCHMLSPTAYKEDVLRITNNEGVPNHCLRSRHSNDWFVARSRSMQLWVEHTSEPFDIVPVLAKAPMKEDLNEPLNCLSQYDLIGACERQSAFYYQVAVMPHYRDRYFLQLAAERYLDKFLELKRQRPDEFWVPTYDIDCIWHAHQLHPWKYEEETAELCGRLLPHDDSVNDRSSGSQLSLRWEQTKQAWKEIFRDEGPYRSGSMYRGTVTAQERLSREQQWNYMRSVIGPDVNIRADVVWKVTLGPAWAEPQRTELKWVHRKDLDNEVNAVVGLRRFSSLGTLNAQVVHGRTKQKSFSYVEVMKDPHKLLPVVTAHSIDFDQLPNEMQVSAEAATCPTLDKQEKAYLIRVAGEDVAVLVGEWAGYRLGKAQKGRPGKKPVRLVGAAGRLFVRMYALRSYGEMEVDAHLPASTIPSSYSFSLMGLKLPRCTEKIHIDLAEGKVWGFTNTISMAVAFGFALTFAALHVGLQPLRAEDEASHSVCPDYASDHKQSLPSMDGAAEVACSIEQGRVEWGLRPTTMTVDMMEDTTEDSTSTEVETMGVIRAAVVVAAGAEDAGAETSQFHLFCGTQKYLGRGDRAMSQLPLPSHPALRLANRNDDDLFEHLEDWLSRLQKLINSNLFPGGAGIPLDLPSGPKTRVAEKELNQSAEVEEALQRRDEQVKEHLEDWLSRVQIFFLDKDKRAGAISEVLPRSPSKSLSNNKKPVANSFQGQLHFGQTLSHTVSLEGLDEEEETLVDSQDGWWSNFVKMMPSSRPIEPESTLAWQRHLQRFVGSTRFESLSATVIITNSIFTAIQVQWAAADPFTPPDDILFIIGSIYTLVFTIELMLRLLAGGLGVVCKEDWGWIALDVVVVGSSIFEFALEITIRLEAEDSSEANVSTSMRLVRVLRVAKITRAIRIVRLVKFVRSLRTLLYCIGRTLRAMLWSGILLLLIIFLFALIFTDITTEYLTDPARDDLVANYIKVRFGALDSSMHTLFACTTGGLTWIETRDSLAVINELWGFLFEATLSDW